ncbi:MAG: hypothetical protein ACLQF1_03885 [Methyloceanibacter sp.]
MTKLVLVLSVTAMLLDGFLAGKAEATPLTGAACVTPPGMNNARHAKPME